MGKFDEIKNETKEGSRGQSSGPGLDRAVIFGLFLRL